MTRHKRIRWATTLLEVLFATIVIVVGLLGIASLIPYAARDAQTANNHSNAVSLGLGWADSFFARELHQPSPRQSQQGYGWRWYRDFTFGGNPPHWEDFVVGVQSFSSFSDFGTTKVNRLMGFTPVCLDPYTMSSSTRALMFQRSAATNSAYRMAVFPYFDDGYDPTSDPLNPSATVDQPRMLRATVGFGEPAVAGTPPPVLGRKVIETLFGSMDHMIEDNYVDPQFATVDSENYPVRRLFAGTGTDPAVARTPALKQFNDGTYTWMATVVPYEPLGTITESALVSFLIMHRHNHSIDFTAQPALLGERVTRVTPLSGNFVGGAGGRVSIAASAEVNDTLEVGNWIMLGRFFVSSGNFYPFFRWYRIIGLDAEPLVNNGVWSREVVLDGPDFAFDTANSMLATYGTILGGVITVVERQVKLR